ncbi:MAG: hypothetical protein AAFX50_13420, partial [Acidobacteriota bacterium]
MNKKSLVGLAILVVVAGIVFLTQSSDELDFLENPEPVEQITVTGFVGGEKSRYLRNPRVVEILRDRYGISFDATKAGSVEMVTSLPTQGKNCLWPSNQVAVEFHRQRGGTLVAEENIFNSPIVLYTWDVVADALIAQGLVSEREGILYVSDFPAVIDKVVGGTEWKDVGLPQLFGKMKIFSTDPRRSNSGNMFSGLLANMMNGGEVVTEASVGAVESELAGYFERMGFMEHSSGDIFENFLKTGVGAKPIIVGYENQLIEFAIEHQEHIDMLRQKIRTLYPIPTVWSSHPIIALDGDCKRLIEAMQDAELQRLAWEQHGFRSGLMGVENDPAALPVSGVPRSIDA